MFARSCWWMVRSCGWWMNTSGCTTDIFVIYLVRGIYLFFRLIIEVVLLNDAVPLVSW